MDQFDTLIEQWGQLNERARQLEDVDYITASYKGFSNEGLTLDEVKDQITEVHHQIATLERQLDDMSDDLS
ncbi:hypothetical protein EFT87_12120 [Schleiferilactobacillus harbinensis]|jgi:Tfp pilus assembly protein PilO|uniref:hypothetical protein n=1 Tax=Schleiferilactobacillus harbinensis TaxID=304207 RepID=UPI0021A62B47|nr:hypothetical protein [Schleiferilactobacillus harbinensis]MCT2909397.1 hypothetical protein [Schleiferilactobacillus harbinensis]